MAAQSTPIPGGESAKGITSWPARVREYIDSLKTEMKHVTWPSKKQVQATTAVVIACVFLFAAYFAVVDLLLGRTVNQLFQSLAAR